MSKNVEIQDSLNLIALRGLNMKFSDFLRATSIFRYFLDILADVQDLNDPSYKIKLGRGGPPY